MLRMATYDNERLSGIKQDVWYISLIAQAKQFCPPYWTDNIWKQHPGKRQRRKCEMESVTIISCGWCNNDNAENE